MRSRAHAPARTIYNTRALRGRALYLYCTGQVVFPRKTALVMGNEVTGVDGAVLAACDGTVEIPTFGLKNSLNVAAAFPVVAFEVLRQWGALAGADRHRDFQRLQELEKAEKAEAVGGAAGGAAAMVMGTATAAGAAAKASDGVVGGKRPRR